ENQARLSHHMRAGEGYHTYIGMIDPTAKRRQTIVTSNERDMRKSNRARVHVPTLAPCPKGTSRKECRADMRKFIHHRRESAGAEKTDIDLMIQAVCYRITKSVMLYAGKINIRKQNVGCYCVARSPFYSGCCSTQLGAHRGDNCSAGLLCNLALLVLEYI